MAKNVPLRDPAYQLFIQEALELLQQIDTTLQEVLQIPSKSSMHFLLELTQTLQEGAQSLGLNQLSNAAQTFSELMLRFQRDPLTTTPDDAEMLRQAYKRMQSTLVTYMPGPAAAKFIDEAEFIDTDQGSTDRGSMEGTPQSFKDAEVAEDTVALSAVEDDVTSLILTTDVAELLEQLDQVLINPQVFDLANELKTLTEALLGWGEVLELSEFITIAQSTLEMLSSNPQTAISVGQLSLAGFRAAYTTALQGSPEADSVKFQPTVPDDLDVVVAEIPTAESLSSSHEVTLNAAQLFVWQQGKLLFTIPSDAVAEISIPRAEQFMGNEHQRCLSWQQQFIPIYPLHQLLEQGKVNWPRLAESRGVSETSQSSAFGSCPFIIIQQGGQTLALEVYIERLVTEAELNLVLLEEHQYCPYFCGETVLTGERYGVIDIARLLNETLELSPLPMPKAIRLPTPDSTTPSPTRVEPAPPTQTKHRSHLTILVVDDSQMVRMMVSLSLQAAGYTVLEAADGQLAIDQLEASHVDLIVCDVEMPNMNGFEFLEYRCRQPQITNIPVVMLSTCNSDQHRQLATTLGANAYLNKPYDEDSFLATLQALIR